MPGLLAPTKASRLVRGQGRALQLSCVLSHHSVAAMGCTGGCKGMIEEGCPIHGVVVGGCRPPLLTSSVLHCLLARRSAPARLLWLHRVPAGPGVVIQAPQADHHTVRERERTVCKPSVTADPPFHLELLCSAMVRHASQTCWHVSSAEHMLCACIPQRPAPGACSLFCCRCKVRAFDHGSHTFYLLNQDGSLP